MSIKTGFLLWIMWILMKTIPLAGVLFGVAIILGMIVLDDNYANTRKKKKRMIDASPKRKRKRKPKMSVSEWHENTVMEKSCYEKSCTQYN